MNDYPAKSCALTRFFITNPKSAPFWLVVRVYLGYEWLVAGWDKFNNPAWFGTEAGAAMQGFVQNALGKTVGAHPDVQLWYASFLQNAVANHLTFWSNAITVGEILVGLGLIVGLCTATAAFWGAFMNLNFLLAGTVSINPIMLVLALGIMTAHRVSGSWGLDRYAQPFMARWCNRSRGKHSPT
ncbi:MAG: DoxX family protein [Minisyncoccia bacterium]